MRERGTDKGHHAGGTCRSGKVPRGELCGSEADQISFALLTRRIKGEGRRETEIRSYQGDGREKILFGHGEQTRTQKTKRNTRPSPDVFSFLAHMLMCSRSFAL